MEQRGLSTLCKTLLLSFLLIAITASSSKGAVCSDRLNQVLASTAPDEMVSVLLFMEEQFDVAAVQARYKLRPTARQAVHQVVIGELKDLAAASQVDLRAVLDQGIADGEVDSYEAYWIANALRVDARRRFIEVLEGRDDIEVIALNEPPQSLYYPGVESPAADNGDIGAGVSEGLRVVGADSMWALGYTGEGVLIGLFDSGVDGSHPALRDSYRGNNGYSARESWFDPVFREDYPHFEPSIGRTYSHGTNTLGVMVGKDDATGDTTGVAWGAQWICAMVVDVPGANYLQAFQWAADPDGDPNTIDDVPDVLNNSWGFTQENIGCLDIFWSAIDNLEALGTVVVFACGNEGSSGPYSLRNPANRATTDLNTFSVGAINPADPNLAIWSQSSRGPSDCDGTSIKPEVVAPGEGIRTTQVNSSYTHASGTSFASPHVAAAAALLRQYNPNATVDEVKLALLNSAEDLGDPGEDNTYGAGVINIPAALELMPPNDEINIYLEAVEHDSIVPGNAYDVDVTLKNSGIGTVDVFAQIINAHPSLTVLEDMAEYGDLGINEIATNLAPYRLEFDSGIPNGALLDVDLEITAGGGSYQKTVKVYFRIGEELVKSDFTHVTDSCKFTISNFGTYGLAPNTIASQSGAGFRYPATGSNNLFQCGLLIGDDSDHVSDGIVNLIGSVDDDFRTAVDGNLRTVSPGYLGDVETFSRFCDSNAVHPIGVLVEQRTASCNAGDCANYVVLEYAISNSSPDPIDGLYVGIYCDWDFPFGSAAGAFDRTGLARSENLGYHWDEFGADFRGTAVLNEEGASSFIAINNYDYVYDGVTEAEKYFFLTAGFDDSASVTNYDQSYCIATGPFSLQPGMSDTAAFAVIGASNLERLRQAAAKAAIDYRAATPVTDDGTVSLPAAYELSQNYPNPFNPETRISYSVARTGRVTIEVYNLLGEMVITLLDQTEAAGTHLISWNGRDSHGTAVASGIYFYRMQTDGFSDVKKMLLLK